MDTTTATETTVPCGWCDEPVIVVEDHGQLVYCTEAHALANVYVPVDVL